MNSPRISVVMSCYNCAPTVGHAIDSILEQTMKDFEFIVIEDGSHDNTLDILVEYTQKDNRIHLIKNEKNIGLAASLNKGIRAARTDIIARMDADDISFHDRFNKQLSCLDQNENIDIVGSGIKEQTKKGILRKTRLLPKVHTDIIKRVFKKPLVYHPTIMIRKKVFMENGFYDPSITWAEDADLWYRIYDKVVFHNLQEPLLYYTIKERMTYHQIGYNLKVKYKNLKRRNIVAAHVPQLLKDMITMSFRMIKYSS